MMYENVHGVNRLSFDDLTRIGPLFVTLQQCRQVEYEMRILRP
jgi:hypothetical protein